MTEVWKSPRRLAEEERLAARETFEFLFERVDKGEITEELALGLLALGRTQDERTTDLTA